MVLRSADPRKKEPTEATVTSLDTLGARGFNWIPANGYQLAGQLEQLLYECSCPLLPHVSSLDPPLTYK